MPQPYVSSRRLVANSLSAMLAAIEIYNKPRMEYRDEVTVLLVVNAWELALKAALKKAGKPLFYKKKRGEPYRTLAAEDALKQVVIHKLFPSCVDGKALAANVSALIEYRNRATHLYAADLGEMVYPFLQTSVLNFRDFMLDHFHKDLADSITWQLLPLGAKAPSEPVQFMKAGPSATAVAEATGVTVLRDGRVEALPADAIALATGGAGQLFAHTTNPAAATGDGLAAAIRAGAEVADLEFFQFHPTALVGPGFLISEAVRGAGALLLDERGRRFMADVDDRAELASRDVVALALHRRQAEQDGRPCFLDARAVPDVKAKFPSITAGLASQGLDLSRDLIPVTPAAHYFMGGVATDRDGRTSIEGLFAVGEVACTGVHGANRLASNSLLEGAVFAARAAAAIDALPVNRDHELPLPQFRSFHQTALTRTELQGLTWAHLGVERTAAGLRTLLDRLNDGARKAGTTTNSARKAGTTTNSARIAGTSTDGARNADDHPTAPAAARIEALETANLALIAEHMARHALAREHSLGAHTRTDTTLTSSTTAPSTATSPTALLQEATAC